MKKSTFLIKFIIVSGGNAIIYGYIGLEASISIPAKINGYSVIEINGYSVIEINQYAFMNCNSLKNVSIPIGVTSIGIGAFSGCGSLTEISISSTVTSIGDTAFFGCSSLTSVTIPNGVTTIDIMAFKDCKSLTSVTIPSSVTSIKPLAFSGCKSLKNIIIPNRVTSIGQNTFTDCSSLTSIYISNSVTSIGVGVFKGCSSLMNVTIPNQVTTIADSTFAECSSLTSVTIPSSVTSIQYGAFKGCKSLTSVIIPNSVTSIGNEAFAECSSLASISISNKLSQINKNLFRNDTSLESVIIPSSVTIMSYQAFNGTINLTVVKFLGNAPSIIDYCGKTSYCNYKFMVYYLDGKTGFPNNWHGYWHDHETERVATITCAANFNSQGGSTVLSKTMEYNTTITVPTAPTKVGYTFVDWYKEALCLNAWNFTTDKVTADTTLYAKWTPQIPVVNVQRLAGINRIETSIAIAKEQYTDKTPDSVVLATANNFADALAGSGLAYKYNAPLLLVGTTVNSSKKVLDYITTNLGENKNIYILGGTGVVSKEISDYLATRGYILIRLGGKNRYETNQKIVDYLNIPKGTSIVIATGSNFADALSISSIADIKGYPILLNGKDNLLDTVSSDITKIQPTTVYIIGGIGVLSTNIETQIKRLNDKINIVRLGGINRYETSMKILDYFKLNTTTITLATGINFPDALSGSILAARKNCGVLLVDNKDIIKQKELLKKQMITDIIVFGGEGVISNSIATSLTK